MTMKEIDFLTTEAQILENFMDNNSQFYQEKTMPVLRYFYDQVKGRWYKRNRAVGKFIKLTKQAGELYNQIQRSEGQPEIAFKDNDYKQLANKWVNHLYREVNLGNLDAIFG